MDQERVLETVNGWIRDHPVRIVIAFLLVTSVFAVGLGNVSTESGTQQFAETTPANRALEAVQREFGPRFSTDQGSTQLIQRDENVLSKDSLIAMLRAQKRLKETRGLRVSETSSAASIVARTINPEARTTDEQIRTLERSTPSEIREAVRANANNPSFTGSVSNDFNPTEARASATIGVVTHELPGGISSSAGQGGDSPLTSIQQRSQRVVDTVDSDITVFGSGIVSAEFGNVIGDSLLIVTPAAILFIVFFLVVAYRDPLDLVLGVVALGMATVWTFGFLGLAGIPFNQIMISVPPLLLAVGIDFGIHAINRYREARENDRDADPGESMTVANEQLLVAFFIVTGTTVIGFLSNYASDLVPIRDFGLVAAVGIVFTFLVFGIFLPAAKVTLDRLRARTPIPTFSTTPLGAEGSSLGRVLRLGVVIAGKAPVAFLAIALVASAGAGYYATGIDTSFTQEDFLPPEETPDYLQKLPEPFAPSDYTVVASLNFLEDNFDSAQQDSVTVYVEDRMTDPGALESIDRAGRDPPDSVLTEERSRQAKSRSILTVIEQQSARDPEFAALVARNDRNGNGIPDRNLEAIYDYLLDSPARGQALEYISEDYRSSRVVYEVESDASNKEITADGRALASRHRGTAIATGQIVVFEAVGGLILESAVTSMLIALSLTVVFLMIIYRFLEGYASLGLANTVPIVVSLAFIAGSMRFLGLSFNAFTATILAITIGLGIDYSVHVVHRYVDERHEHPRMEALDRTVRGTGGALAGSMVTTASGIGVLVFAVLAVLGQFGLITALSIVYAFLSSLLVLPSTLVVWDWFVAEDASVPLETAEEPAGEPVAG
jgi:predicted RND superfamily exporter protein